jgi:hypothetical protein
MTKLTNFLQKHSQWITPLWIALLFWATTIFIDATISVMLSNADKIDAPLWLLYIVSFFSVNRAKILTLKDWLIYTPIVLGLSVLQSLLESL